MAYHFITIFPLVHTHTQKIGCTSLWRNGEFPQKVTSFVQEQMQDQNTNWKEGSGKKMERSVLKAAQAFGAKGSSGGGFGELED